MARPRKDVSAYFGKRIKGTRLTVAREAGRDSRGRILVKVHCDCEKRKVKVVVLSQVLSGHTKSCGCLKHQRYVEHTQRAVDRLTPTQIRQCFLAKVDKKSPKPALSPDVIKAGYYRRTEELKSLPNSVMVTARERVMAHDAYASIAEDTGLHSAEVAWLAKHIIRPEVMQRDRALLNISKAKIEREQELERLKEEKRRRRGHREREWQLDYEEWQRGRELQEERFSASELHNPGSKVSRTARLDLDSLDFAWHWMKTNATHMKLDSDEQDLLKWFRETGERTFQWRRSSRRRQAERKLREHVAILRGRRTALQLAKAG